MSNDKKDPKQLLEEAHRAGALSATTLSTLDVADLGAQIQAGLGVSVDDVASSEVVLVTMMQSGETIESMTDPGELIGGR